MSFLDTEPAAIHRLDTNGAWARFRVTDPRQREATLRELCRADVPLTVGVAGGPNFPALLWALDEAQQQLLLSPSPSVAPDALQAVLLQRQIWAAGYLHEAKVQFDIRELAPAPDTTPPMLRAALPMQMVHLPRRRALRVRRAEAQAPTASFKHPLAGDLAMQLRVADISMTGCALWKPAAGVMLVPGTEIRQVRVLLDPDVAFEADMQVLHLTPGPSGGRGPRGLRVGCDWRGMSAQAAETLQTWIARGRRRRDLVSLSFD
jgi:c-di-GMP-binding flagellar brake protein YcgR